MQILKVYDNGPPAMEVGTTQKYELKDKDSFRLTARPKFCAIFLETAKQKGSDCNASQLSCRLHYIPEGALERACTAGVT